jgi:hypothetical protein
MFWALVGDRHTSTVDMAVGRQAAYRLVKESETFFFFFTPDLPVYRSIDAVVVYVMYFDVVTLEEKVNVVVVVRNKVIVLY